MKSNEVQLNYFFNSELMYHSPNEKGGNKS